MRTMHTVVKRGALYWNRDLLPPSLYEARLFDLRQRVAAAGDDAWLLVGDVIRHGPVVYATNFMPRVRSALAYIPRDAAPTLFGNISTRDIPAARLITGVEDIRAFSRLPKELSTFLQEVLPDGGRIGTCGVEACLPITDWQAIEAAVPALTFVQRDSVVAGLRRKKEPCEVAAIRLSAGLADVGLERAREVLAPGRCMREVAAEIDRAARSRGAEDVRLLVATGPQVHLSLRPADDRVLAAGDTALIYLAVQHQRYWGIAAQTLVLGTASQELRALHAAGAEALDSMIARARPGAPACSLLSGADGALGDSLASAMAYGLGRGIGLDLEEGPSIAPENKTGIERGETMGLRIVLPGATAGAILARTIHVGANDTTSLGAVRPLVELPA